MNIWLITVGEPLPWFEPSGRRLRTGILARQLVRGGHRVTWWTSTFNHFTHAHYTGIEDELNHEGIRYCLLRAPGYDRNVSLSRLFNHYLLGRRFARAARRENVPDLILCSFPTIELSLAAVRHGRDTGCPVVLDVRDRWPDIFLGAVRPLLRPAGRLVLAPYDAMTRRALAGCTAIIAVSAGYLNWALDRAGRPRREHDGVYPLGYERASAGPESAQALLAAMGIPSGKAIAWFVGSFSHSYDLSTVIAAARLMRRDGLRELIFVLSGTGEDEPRLRAAARGMENVIFTGWIDQSKIQAIGGAASFGLQAYRADAEQGLANKLFEYLSFGLPIVSSLDGENGAFLEQHRCGERYKAGDPASLTAVLQRLLNHRNERETLAANARRAFEAGYSAETVYAPLVVMLERLARQYSAPRPENRLRSQHP